MIERLSGIAYNLMLTALWPAIALYYAVRARTDGKYRASYQRRLGLELPEPAAKSGAIWVHALSVGETLSALPLLAALRQALPDRERVLSSATESGHRIACLRAGQLSTRRFILAHDMLWSMSAVIRRIRPALFVLVETDLWPNLLWLLERRRVPMVLVNGRISDRSLTRLRLLKPAATWLLDRFQLIFCQSDRDRERFLKLGADPAQVFTVGNLKFDLVRAQAADCRVDELRAELDLSPERLVWIAGSTHPGEEDALLDAHLKLRRCHPHLLLILAPRHPARGWQIASRCQSRDLAWGLRSRRDRTSATAVYLVDTLGELARFYALAQAAFIGGSLVPLGGHNPLEAAVHGVPCCWGPHLSNFREIEATLVTNGCGRMTASGAAVADQIDRWLSEPELRTTARAHCTRLFAAEGQAAARIVDLMTSLLDQGSAWLCDSNLQ